MRAQESTTPKRDKKNQEADAERGKLSERQWPSQLHDRVRSTADRAIRLDRFVVAPLLVCSVRRVQHVRHDDDA
jgi:hypothetical protein